MGYTTEEKTSASINSQAKEEGTLNLSIDGRLDSYTTGDIWKKAVQILEQSSPKQIVVDASGINYCDGSEIALSVKLRQLQEKSGGEFEVKGLASDFQQRLNLFLSKEFKEQNLEKPNEITFPEEVGSGITQKVLTQNLIIF